VKKLSLTLFYIVLFSLVSSCSLSKNETFYYELGRVSKNDYDAIVATIPLKETYTYNDVKSYRLKFREKYQYDFSSQPNNTEEDIYSFLTTRGFSPSEANSEIDVIKNRGNRLLFFNYAYSSSYIMWMYIELQ
jgi:hypothetical protein